MKIVRRHITFYGWVQGVGFRYRARHAAELYGCTGWVRAEWDSSVTMEIQPVGMSESRTWTAGRFQWIWKNEGLRRGKSAQPLSCSRQAGQRLGF